MAPCLDVYAAAAGRQRRTSARRCWPRCSPPRSSRRAASPASRSPRPRRGCRRTRAIPKVAEAIRRRQDAAAKLARRSIASATSWPRPQRQGAARRAGGDRRRRPRQADRRRAGRRWPMPMRRCRRRRRTTASSCSRWCRPATCSPRCIRTRRSSRSPSATTTAGCSCCATARSRCPGSTAASTQIAELVRRVRAGIELTTDSAADLRHRRRAEAVPD